MSGPVIQVSSAADFTSIIAGLSQTAFSFKIPVFRAAANGLIGLAEIQRDSRAPLKLLDQSGRPSLIVVGDDDAFATGPAGWRATRKLVAWARAGLIHGTGGETADYSNAVLLAQRHGRCVLVETDSAHVDAWEAAFAAAPRRLAGWTKRPPPGQVHPVPVARESRQ